ncbi:MAG: hypothetical protein IPG79_15140 [Saprospiraceae bacterium]|nr:hypothetical protein [Saprospiraceae bacterium]
MFSNKNFFSGTIFQRNWLFTIEEIIFTGILYFGKTRYFTFYIGNKTIFCKWETIIEKQSKVPLRFRLGNLDYVNTLENKN